MVIVKVVMSAGCRCQAAQSFAERLAIANRHDIVQYRIDGRREEIKTPCHFQKELVSAVGWHSYCNCINISCLYTCYEKHFLVYLAVVGRILGVNIEEPLGVERSPTDEKGNHNGNCANENNNILKSGAIHFKLFIYAVLLYGCIIFRV